MPPPTPVPVLSRDATRDDPGLPRSLMAIFLRFLRFGLLAWGGPTAQIAMLKQELVDEERWIEPDKFNRVLAVYQVLPGPEAMELCCYFGTLRAGRLGGLVAGLAFVLPGLVFMLGLAALYAAYGLSNPWALAALAACQPAVVALVARGAYRIGRHALDEPMLWAAAAVSVWAAFTGVHFALVLALSGAAVAISTKDQWLGFFILAALASAGLVIGPLDYFGTLAAALAVKGQTVAPEPIGLFGLFASGLKAGMLSFGGAYTALPFLQADSVNAANAWLKQPQFLDGLALGGVIPAPLVIISAFVGYMGGGLAGGLVCAAGMFLPAFAFTLLGHRRLEAVIDDERLHAFLAGVTAGVVGLIAATGIDMLLLFRGPRAWLIFAVALAAVCLWKSRWATPVVVLTAAASGILWRLLAGA